MQKRNHWANEGYYRYEAGELSPERKLDYMYDPEKMGTHLIQLQRCHIYWRKATLKNWNHIAPRIKESI
jgi:hypothetical protein